MRISAFIFAATFVALSAPVASACRVAPLPVDVPQWEREPTPSQLRPGEVALEVEFAGSVGPTHSSDPDLIITGCQAFQDVFHIVRVIAGDVHGAEFVITRGTTINDVTVFDPNATSAPPEPKRVFLVGYLFGQEQYFIAAFDPGKTNIPMIKQGSDLIDHAIPVIDARPQP